MLHKFTCSVCNEHKTHESSFSTGYGIDKLGNKVCFECCGKQDASELSSLPIGGKTILYLDTKNKCITNWPGTFKLNIGYIRTGKHNMAGKRYDVWFKYSGNVYHGTQYGDNTQICHIKRVKA